MLNKSHNPPKNPTKNNNNNKTLYLLTKNIEDFLKKKKQQNVPLTDRGQNREQRDLAEEQESTETAKVKSNDSPGMGFRHP